MNNEYFKQHTIKREVRCGGIGLHSGAGVSMNLKPAPCGHGVRFCRLDLPGHPVISAHHHHVVDTFLATSIGSSGVVITTVEHLMAALLGSGVDNVRVELDGPEVPIFDGSAAPYLDILKDAGLREQEAARQCLVVERPLLVREGEAYIKATPSDRFHVRYSIDFPHPLVGKQDFSWSFDESTFGQDIAKARTFGFLKDVQRLQSSGLAQGGSLANAMVFDEHGLLNKDGFRYTDECVRHKVLDFVGDLALAGMPVRGRFEVHKAGHALHNSFLRQLTTKPGYSATSMLPCVPMPFFRGSAIPPFAERFPHMGKSL